MSTTISGNIKDLGIAATSGVTMRFWLRGCQGNQPRVNGSALIAPTQGGIFYFDLISNSSGAISGTLYSTRDAAGTGNGEIEVGGSFTAVWYGMQAIVNGKAGPEVPVHAKNGATLDITNVTPISTTPVSTAPAGDATYLRLDGGNSPYSGNDLSPVAGNTAQSLGLTGSRWVLWATKLNDTSGSNPAEAFQFDKDAFTTNLIGVGQTSRVIGILRSVPVSGSGQFAAGQTIEVYTGTYTGGALTGNDMIGQQICADRNSGSSTRPGFALVALLRDSSGTGLTGKGPLRAYEIDFVNNSGGNAVFGGNSESGKAANSDWEHNGQLITSVGNNKGGIGLLIKSNNPGAGNWIRGIVVMDYDNHAVHLIHNSGNGDNMLVLDSASTGQNEDILWRDAGTDKWVLGKSSGNDFSIFDAVTSKNRLVCSAPSSGNSDTRVNPTGTGKVKLNWDSGSGVQFGDGSSNSVAAMSTAGVLSGAGVVLNGGSTLANYVEGTFTPGIAFGGGTTGITYTTQVGFYTRIGNRVFFNARITLSSKGSSVGSATVTGLPVTSNNTANNFNVPILWGNNLAVGVTTALTGTIAPNATTIALQRYSAGAPSNLADTDFNSNTDLIISGSYAV